MGASGEGEGFNSILIHTARFQMSSLSPIVLAGNYTTREKKFNKQLHKLYASQTNKY
jgi:hypothetical protein